MEKPNVHWWSTPRTLLRTILMLDDSDQSIALGTTIGMFIGLTPTVGIQMILVALFAALTSPFLRFNRLAAIITVYVSNPLTVAPIYWFNYKVGTYFVSEKQRWTTDDFRQLLSARGIQETLEALRTLFVDVGQPLILGSLIVATAISLPTYPLMRRLLKKVKGEQSPLEIPDAVDQAETTDKGAENRGAQADSETPAEGEEGTKKNGDADGSRPT